MNQAGYECRGGQLEMMMRAGLWSWLVVVGAMASVTTSAAAQDAASRRVVPAPAASASRPARVDLRPELRKLGVLPRGQGPRPTCSVFTTGSALDTAYSRLLGEPTVISMEYLNWAKNRAAHGAYDGGFFHDILAGFAQSGVCREQHMPYGRAFDAAAVPGDAAVADARALEAAGRGRIVVHWIHPISQKPGITPAEFDSVLAVLANHWPVATGSGHSRLVVGYADDATKPGGGTFISQDSALNAYGEVTYEFIKTGIYDAFWIEALPAAAASPHSQPASRPAPHQPRSP